MARSGFIVLLSAAPVALLAFLAPVVHAAERQVIVEGVQDRALRAAIERAIGDQRAAPAGRVEARRRAAAAAANATALLRSEGYYDYSVDPDIGAGEHPHALIVVKPGPRSVLGPSTLAWDGPPPTEAAKLATERSLGLRPGRPAEAAEILAAEGRALATLQQNGYADASSGSRRVVVDHADHRVSATFTLKAGLLVRLGDLELSGKTRTARTVVRRLKPWKRGDVYSPKAVAELERRLLDTHVYDAVSVALAPQPAADGLRPVLVSLADRQRNSLGVEAGYSSTEGGDVDLKLSQFNRLGLEDTITYEVRYGSIDSRVGIELSLPHFAHPGQTLTTDAAFFQSVTNAYKETGVQILGDLTQRFGATTFLTRGGSVTASQVDDFQTGTINIVTLRVLGAFALDRTDNPLDPRRGFKLSARVEPTQILEDETLTYLKAQTQFSAYLPLERSGVDVVAGRIHLGTILGGNIPGVPASDRFYAGGGGSVRGYEYQSVGPHYPDNIPIGGLSLVELSAEIRHRFSDALGGVLFMDTGSVSEQSAPDFRHTLSAVGIGVRYNLGFAPLRADIAFPLQQANGASQQAFQVYLSIGQSF